MKKSLWMLAVSAIVIAGCSKPPVNAPAELQKGFAKAEPEVKEEVQKASAQLQSGNYLEAMQALQRVVSARQNTNQPMSEEQRKAVGAAVVTAREAIARDPKLNTPQLYKVMTELVEHAYGEN